MTCKVTCKVLLWYACPYASHNIVMAPLKKTCKLLLSNTSLISFYPNVHKKGVQLWFVIFDGFTNIENITKCKCEKKDRNEKISEYVINSRKLLLLWLPKLYSLSNSVFPRQEIAGERK